MIDQTVTLEDFADLLEDEEFKPETLELLLKVLAEIKPYATSFQGNTPELVQLAALYSLTFQTLPAERQRSFASIMTMPIFFMTLPMNEEEASQWMEENK